MALPTVEDVNETRVARFRDDITEALGSDQVGFFRDLVLAYERDHDVPAADVAAALAVLRQDDRPLLMEPEPPRAPRAAGSGSGSAPRQRPTGDVPLATYRIAVGKRHKVEPRQIVGAIANEGGLRRQDFGRIDIRGDHSLVELPADLSAQTLTALERTRISGKLIELAPTEEGASAGDAPPTRAASRTTPRTKPRTKPRSKPGAKRT
jgi:ATP-dependent RNA helicase DeaD